MMKHKTEKKKSPGAGTPREKRAGLLLATNPSDYTLSGINRQIPIENNQYDDPLVLDAALALANADLKAATDDKDWIDAYLRWLELHTLKCGLEARVEVSP